MKIKKYHCTVTLHSEIGDTPLTNRGKFFRDKLAIIRFKVSGPVDARKKCIELINKTAHAVHGFCCAPTLDAGPITGFESGGLFGCEWRKKLRQAANEAPRSKYGPMQKGIDNRSVAEIEQTARNKS